MTSQEVRQLVQFLLEASPYPAGLSGSARLQHCLHDPEFGWNFVMAHVQLGKRLPVQARTPTLLRAYRWRAAGTTDNTLEEAYSLRHPAAETVRHILHGLLICPDLTLENIAELLNMPAEVVRLYEQLFFSVRDRLNDRLFMARLIFPETRLPNLNALPMTNNRGQELLRIAQEHGSEELLFVTGLTNKREPIDVDIGYHELETAVVTNALALARHGGLNRKDAPGINHARTLLAARKRTTEPAPDIQTAARKSLGDSVADELEKVAREGARRQLDVIKARAKGDQPTAQEAGNRQP